MCMCKNFFVSMSCDQKVLGSDVCELESQLYHLLAEKAWSD